MNTNKPPASQPQEVEEDEEEEDDYMNMTFADPAPTIPETSLQRRQREKREALARGQVKSKAQLAAEASAAREAALSRSLLESAAAARKSKGFAMMAKMGFKPGAVLGSRDNAANARAEPIGIEIKENRGGIGLDGDRKRKIAEASEGVVKKARVDEMDYRERMRREREGARREKQFYAAQKIAEGMSEERGGGLVAGGGDEDGDQDEEEEDRAGKRNAKASAKISSRPLKSINVLWRGLVRSQEENERNRRMRHDMENGLLSSLPTYEDDQEDEDDRKALGKTTTVYTTADDLDEVDEELDEFNALEADEKLRRIVEFLRKEHHYCFWCKYTYPDETMDGCPGLTEEDHD